MTRGLLAGVLWLGVVPAAPAADRPAADFKLVIELFGTRKEPIARADLVVRDGRAYQFFADAPEEVIIIDPARSRVTLYDLKRQVQTELTAGRLDAAVAKVYRTLKARVERQEKSDDRALKVSAAMTRDLMEPKFAEAFDAASSRLTLSNPTVQVEVRGEPEPDDARRAVIANGLAALTKLTALREPDGLPPFALLETLRASLAGHKLRPSEISVLYRLAGKPRRLRWTYKVVPALTGRESEALSRVDKMRATARYLPYDLYDAGEGGG